MNKPDTIRITFDQNPAVMEALRDRKPGDKFVFTRVETTIKGQDGEGADFTVEAYIPEGYEKVPDTEEPRAETLGSGADVAMTPAAMMIRRKTKS